MLNTEKIHFRFANNTDADLYFKWANDIVVRSNSYNQNEVNYNDHILWFNTKLAANNCFFYLFLNASNTPVGQVRIDKTEKETIIGISIDEHFRGHGLATILLNLATDNYLTNFSNEIIIAYIKLSNQSSYKSFIKAGFEMKDIKEVNGCKSYTLFKKR